MKQTFTLTVEVTYETDKDRKSELTQQLYTAAEHLHDQGLLTGDLVAEVAGWGASVRILN